MKVTIGSSSQNDIDDKYKESADKVIDYLASCDCDLIWGCASSSIMGMCYRAFEKRSRKIYGFTTPKYVSDLSNLENAENIVCENTFNLKNNLFYKSDIILMLPGGTGTVSEFFAFLEEIRANDIDKKLIIYNENGHFDSTLALIDDLVKRNFNSKNIYDYFMVVNNLDELKSIIKECR